MCSGVLRLCPWPLRLVRPNAVRLHADLAECRLI